MSHGCLNSYVFQQRRATCSLEIRSCTLVAIGALHPAGTGNFSSAYLLQTKGAFLEFCRKAVGTRNGGLFQRLLLSGFATDCPLLQFNWPQHEAGACATIRAMDVEKTIEFILDQQAKTEALWQRNEERWQRAEERMDKFDQSLIRIRKLIQLGAKTLLSTQKAAKVELREIREDIRELTAAQKRTDQKFDRLVELLSRRSPNGRH
jgi:hypothetical protein